jgi:hypothetical protein
VLTGLLGHCGLGLTVAGQAGLDLIVVHRLISLSHPVYWASLPDSSWVSKEE